MGTVATLNYKNRSIIVTVITVKEITEIIGGQDEHMLHAVLCEQSAGLSAPSLEYSARDFSKKRTLILAHMKMKTKSHIQNTMHFKRKRLTEN